MVLMLKKRLDVVIDDAYVKNLSFYLEKDQVAGLISDCDELLKIGGSMLITLRKKHS